ncbi:predicted protein [Naegleria gruberi]|uniref:Predicted protein n=1 Tax=Naegleria gruberi TaxID=5762 RepID=D2VVM1_NAEGR|nr:uncharacterized protein NAEGRDRAFT_81394 [Naegleria gruberi]EFC39064.1 predicted protein [Naegleria gruberi]|eukprot:XP_002671808.1 predicted protein [Naegleria gruberi strain NEG-M]
MLLCVLKMLTGTVSNTSCNHATPLLHESLNNHHMLDFTIQSNQVFSAPTDKDQISNSISTSSSSEEEVEKPNTLLIVENGKQRKNTVKNASKNNSSTKITKRNRNIRKRYQTLVLSFFNEPFKIQTVESMKSKFANKA